MNTPINTPINTTVDEMEEFAAMLDAMDDMMVIDNEELFALAGESKESMKPFREILSNEEDLRGGAPC